MSWGKTGCKSNCKRRGGKINQTIFFFTRGPFPSELCAIKYSFKEDALGLNWTVLYLEKQKPNRHQGF